MEQRIALVDALRQMKGEIEERRHNNRYLAELLTPQLGFAVTEHHVRSTAEALGIRVRQKKVRATDSDIADLRGLVLHLYKELNLPVPVPSGA